MKTWYDVKFTHGKYEVWFCYQKANQEVQRIHVGDAINEQEANEVIAMFRTASDTQQVNVR